MKLICLLLVGLICVKANSTPEKQHHCTLGSEKIPEEWKDMVRNCSHVLREQVKTEISACMTYLAMGAEFATDERNRLGFSNFFFDSASEEREHAIKIIEYLLMRGELTSDVQDLLHFPLGPKRETWSSGAAALRSALELEASVTKNIQNIIKICEQDRKFNDYHLVDYLTGEFLDEQYKGQRDLAGKLSTLSKMDLAHGKLGEFLFDKKLLYGEI